MENDVYKKMPGHKSAGVSAQPIRLTIAGRDLPTLTIVDLPGTYQTLHCQWERTQSPSCTAVYPSMCLVSLL